MSTKNSPIVLSLRDDRFKSIIYRHFRLLGLDRDKTKESKAIRNVFDELVNRAADPQFCKLTTNGEREFVSEEVALKFIRDAVQKRSRTQKLWQRDKSKKLDTSKGGAAVQSSRREVGRRGKATKSDENGNNGEALAPVRKKSPRIGHDNNNQNASSSSTTATTTSSSSYEQSKPPDILLSMSDPYYKQTILHHLEQRRKKVEISSDVNPTHEIYNKFQKHLEKSGGDFYRIKHVGGERYCVRKEEVVLKKIKADLCKGSRYDKELDSTIVLDLERDKNYSTAVNKYYNAKDPEEKIANQIRDELRKDYNFFVRIVDGDRVEINLDEEEHLILSIILGCVRKRRGNERPVRLRRKRPLYSPVPEESTTSPPSKSCKRKATSISSPQNDQPNQDPSILNESLSNLEHLTVKVKPRMPETVSQLVDNLELATKKLNELHGTSRRHSKALRLHQLVELGGDGDGNLPTLKDVAKCMKVRQVDICKWFKMQKCAESRGYNLKDLGDELIDFHTGLFEDGDIFVVDEDGEELLDQFFDRMVEDVMTEIETSGARKKVRSSIDEVKESDEEGASEIDELKQPGNETQKMDNEMNGKHDNAASTATGENKNVKKETDIIDTINSNIETAETKASKNEIEMHGEKSQAAKLKRTIVESAENEATHDEMHTQVAKMPDENDLHSGSPGLNRSSANESVPKQNDPTEAGSEEEKARNKKDNSVKQVASPPHDVDKRKVNDLYNQMKSSIATITESIGSRGRSEKCTTARDDEAIAENADCVGKKSDSNLIEVGKVRLKGGITSKSDTIKSNGHPPREEITLQCKTSADEKPAAQLKRPAKDSTSNSTKRSDPAKPSMNSEHNLAQKSPSQSINLGAKGLLSKIEKGSRVIVKWGKDETLFRATVKKVQLSTQGGEPTIRVHYDGKKSHIVDKVTLDMIDGLLHAEKKIPKQNKKRSQKNTKSPDSIVSHSLSIKDLLRGKYTTVPSGMPDHREQCPELGAGWTVYIKARRVQEDNNSNLRADRYFISPSGKHYRSITALEKYHSEHPEEFDLCYSGENSNDESIGEMLSLTPSTSASREKTKISPAAGESLKESLPQCSGATDQQFPTEKVVDSNSKGVTTAGGQNEPVLPTTTTHAESKKAAGDVNDQQLPTSRGDAESEKASVGQKEPAPQCRVNEQQLPTDITNEENKKAVDGLDESLPKTTESNADSNSEGGQTERSDFEGKKLKQYLPASTSHTSETVVIEPSKSLPEIQLPTDSIGPMNGNVANESKETLNQSSGDNDQQISTPSMNAESECQHFAAANFSPLMISQPRQAMEDSQSDHEFFTSLMDEKGLLFGDEDSADGSKGSQSESVKVKTTESVEACALKPMSYKGEGGNDGNSKTIVHSANQDEETESLENESLNESKTSRKKGLSPRMKRNKKALIGGILPVFAMDTPLGAEFAGYLGKSSQAEDSGPESEEEASPPSAAKPCDVKNSSDFPHMNGTNHLIAASSFSPKLSPITVQERSNISSFVRISPISLHCKEEASLAHKDTPSDAVHRKCSNSALKKSVSCPKPQRPIKKPQTFEPTKPHSELKSASSPDEVSVVNMKPAHSAFVAVPPSDHSLPPPIFPPSSAPHKKAPSEPRKSENVQLFAFEYNRDENSARPKRKLKATVRFDPDMTDSRANSVKTGTGFICPRCDFVCDYGSKVCGGCQLECYYEAGVGVVTLKERGSVGAQYMNRAPLPAKKTTSNYSRPENVLCNCTYCKKGPFSIQGIYAHYGKSHQSTHGKKLDWSKITFSCPFCKGTSSETYNLSQVERHVQEIHPGCNLVTPNTDKPPKNRARSKASSPPPQAPLRFSPRATTTRDVHSKSSHHDPSLETYPKWTKLDHRSLLPDSKKDYPREIAKILDLVDEQCKLQEELVAKACDQRLKLCKAEAETEAKLWDEDRLAYQRGIRERSRHADAERIEKQRFTESHKLMLMQYEYENRNRKRTRDEVEAEKLCSKPIVFANTRGRNLPSTKNACRYDKCELCKVDSTYLQTVMLDAEMASLSKDNPSQSLPPKANVLNPSFHVISGDYFAKAEEHFEDGTEVSKVVEGNSNGSRKVKQSRRDVATSKRLRIEEDKLFKMRTNQHSLKFISRYNEGLICNAWKTR